MIANPLALADWRRQVAELYGEVRRYEDPAAGWQHWRAARDRLIRHHPQSPLSTAQRPRFKGLPFFEYDPRYRFQVSLDQPETAETQAWHLGADGTIMLQPIARTFGLAEVLGGELTVFWIGGYGGGVFLPFADAHEATYAGGRYLLDGIKGADLGSAGGGKLICDFNFAYNPSCAYADTWTCPLAPPENRLPGPVPAGERAEPILASA
ncbi:DUF1684 domain-containing protein [Ferruginivarius sediminum]|uniref:DUF1684 domain-containing protein n=1 Tax=Ferruginivarius sediminum TaxID=2661937 RepID=A0A369TEY7_9PROT|nr:DUF1684 domain-containing protein [Ferruginivarius sediminum]RDD63919.1 DUF1684 domain-containing protein [Ferruginivarius sediminum]